MTQSRTHMTFRAVVRCFYRVVMIIELWSEGIEHGGIGIACKQDVQTAGKVTYVMKNKGKCVLRFGVQCALCVKQIADGFGYR